MAVWTRPHVADEMANHPTVESRAQLKGVANRKK